MKEDILNYLNEKKRNGERIKIGELVDLLIKKQYNNNNNKEKIAKEIYELIEEGKIRVIEKNNRFFSTFFSFRNSWYLFSIFVITLSLVSSIFISNNYILIKGIIVSPLLFFYPGYGIVESIYPKREEWNELERAALSIGMSLAILPLIGLILNLMPFGLNVESVSISIYIFSLIMLIIARYRKYQYERLKYEKLRGI